MRCAIAAGAPALAERLAEAVKPILPLHEHSGVTAQALMAEANGEHLNAAEDFADASTRWESFESVLEQAYALLGRGRCLVALGDSAAEQPLRAARALFDEMGARPRVAECDEILSRSLAQGA